MPVLGITRRILHILVLVFSIVVLGISANLAALAGTYGANLTFADFALAVSVITLVVLVSCIILDRVCKNAVFSWTAVEVAWTFVLWVLWLAVAAYTTNLYSDIECSSRSYDVLLLTYELRLSNASALSTCQQVQALMGIPFVIWILLFILFVYLLIVGIMHHNSGNPGIWTLSAADTNFGATGGPTGAYPMAQASTAQGAYPAVQTNPTPVVSAPTPSTTYNMV